MTLTSRRIQGAEIEPHLATLADLRISVFREYPYLYDGDLDYERRYLASYATAADSVVILASAGDRVVGAATGMPLVAHGGDVVPPLRTACYEIERVFYFGESVLDREFRGRGLGHRFLDEREAFARERGFTTATFCAVVRPADHPQRPAAYRPLDDLWVPHGFVRRPDITTTFSWRDLGESEETSKRMEFWVKELE